MGFHVNCSGAELLHGLRANASQFLHEPYSLYFIALATQVDDEALKWLHKYEMQLDSLCGPYAAFLTFYNQARLFAEPSPRMWTQPLTNLNSDLDSDRHQPQLQDAAIEVELKSSVLNGGSGAVDAVLRFDPRAQTDKDVVVTSNDI